jgi:hypothetical protein
VLLGSFAVEPVLAQSVGNSFCTTDMAETIRNVFTIIQFGGPLIGGTIFLGATVALPVVRTVDLKREIKELRTQGLVWGVIVAPLATAILQFLLNNVVSGGAGCGGTIRRVQSSDLTASGRVLLRSRPGRCS